MVSLLASKDRVARKQHTCFYCGKTIEKGETYAWSKTAYDGEINEWKLHKKCDFIANKLWNYIDPDQEGMSAEDFREGCVAFYTKFICPEASDISGEKERSCHINEIYDFLQENELKRTTQGTDWMLKWVCVLKQVEA